MLSPSFLSPEREKERLLIFNCQSTMKVHIRVSEAVITSTHFILTVHLEIMFEDDLEERQRETERNRERQGQRRRQRGRQTERETETERQTETERERERRRQRER